MSRVLYLVCYDVANPKRLRHVHQCVRSFAIGGQKSFYECWMTQGDVKELLDSLGKWMDLKNDRIHLFELDPREIPIFYGRAYRQGIVPFLVV